MAHSREGGTGLWGEWQCMAHLGGVGFDCLRDRAGTIIAARQSGPRQDTRHLMVSWVHRTRGWGEFSGAAERAAAKHGNLPRSWEKKGTGAAPPRPREGWTGLWGEWQCMAHLGGFGFDNQGGRGESPYPSDIGLRENTRT